MLIGASVLDDSRRYSPGFTVVRSAIGALFAGGDNLVARYATVSAVTGQRSGLTAVDGTTLVAGDIVLDDNNNTASFRGLWLAATGNWTRAPATLTSGVIVAVTQGTANKDTLWILDTQNPITTGVTSLTFTQFVSGSTDFHSVTATSTANLALPVSGTQTVDGASVAANSFALLANQTTPSENGVYKAGSPWTKLTVQPSVVFSLTGSTQNRLTFFLTAANTWSANEGVYA